MDAVGAGVRTDAAGLLRHPGEQRRQLAGAPAADTDSTHLVAGSSCSDTSVPTGSYRYVVTAVFATWTAVSSPSGSVSVVDVPPPYVASITLADPSPTSDPATSTGR